MIRCFILKATCCFFIRKGNGVLSFLFSFNWMTCINVLAVDFPVLNLTKKMTVYCVTRCAFSDLC